MVESQPSKLLVAGSIPVSRSSLRSREPAPRRELRLGKPGEGCRAEARRAKADDLPAASEASVQDLSAVAASEAGVQRRPM